MIWRVFREMLRVTAALLQGRRVARNRSVPHADRTPRRGGGRRSEAQLRSPQQLRPFALHSQGGTILCRHQDLACCLPRPHPARLPLPCPAIPKRLAMIDQTPRVRPFRPASPSAVLRSRIPALLGVFAAGLLAGCSGSNGADVGGGGGGGGGGASLVKVEFGRLADVYGLARSGTTLTVSLFQTDVMVGPDIQDERDRTRTSWIRRSSTTSSVPTRTICSPAC